MVCAPCLQALGVSVCAVVPAECAVLVSGEGGWPSALIGGALLLGGVPERWWGLLSVLAVADGWVAVGEPVSLGHQVALALARVTAVGAVLVVVAVGSTGRLLGALCGAFGLGLG